MRDFVKKYGKWISAVIIISILVSGVPLFLNAFKWNQVRAVENDYENRIAAEVSNMTGVKVEEVKRLRGLGQPWNEVLNNLKRLAYSKDNSERRDAVLTNTDLGEDYVKKLQDEGYDKDKIMDVKLRAERVIYDLKEITSSEVISVSTPKVEDNLQPDKESFENCKKINEKFDIKTAVYLCVKLEKDFGSIDKVLDEYLLSIQLEINLEEYLIDKKDYEKQKAKKLALSTKAIVTLEKIEDMLLKKLQSAEKDKNKDSSAKTDPLSPSKHSIKDKNTSPLPDSPVPEIKDNKPQNPVNEIMKEIQIIDPMKNGGK